MKHFFRRTIPPFERVLLVESGSRYLMEDLLPGIYENHGERIECVDLLTCYPGLPKTFDSSRGQVFRVADFQGGAGRSRLYKELASRRYLVCGVICAGEPIMTKWKWVVGAKVPAKIFVLNENGDYFWLHWENWRSIRHFALFRAGLAGAGAVRTLARLAMFPFTLTYLLLYAATAHLKRKARA